MLRATRAAAVLSRLRFLGLLGSLLMFGGCDRAATPVAGADGATWRVDSIPFIDLGNRDDDTLELVGFAQGVALIGDTVVVIGDREHKQLRYFDRDGSLVRTVGREGDGPGEFRYLYRFMRCGDSLHVQDITHKMWAVYGDDGAYIRTYPDVAPASVKQPTYAAACNASGQFIKYPYPFPEVMEVTKLRPMVPIWMAGPSGATIAELGEFPGPELLAQPSLSWGLSPLGPVTVVAIGRNRAYVGMADSSTILTYRLDGTLLSAIETGLLPRRTTESDREHYRVYDTLGLHSRITRLKMQQWGTLEFPASLPAYSSLLVDMDDLLWVRGYPHNSHTTVRWTVFTETGTVVGGVDLPRNLEVSEIGADFVLGIETLLSDGSQRVRAYRLHR